MAYNLEESFYKVSSVTQIKILLCGRVDLPTTVKIALNPRNTKLRGTQYPIYKRILRNTNTAILPLLV